MYDLRSVQTRESKGVELEITNLNDKIQRIITKIDEREKNLKQIKLEFAEFERRNKNPILLARLEN